MSAPLHLGRCHMKRTQVFTDLSATALRRQVAFPSVRVKHEHMLKTESLYAALPSSHQEEVFTTLFEKAGVKIERIDSHGQASPEGFWYDQPQDEWVLLVKGEATLEVAGQPPAELRAGDHVLIPARVRHRVTRTTQDALWLAVHVNVEG